MFGIMSKASGVWTKTSGPAWSAGGNLETLIPQEIWTFNIQEPEPLRGGQYTHVDLGGEGRMQQLERQLQSTELAPFSFPLYLSAVH